MLHEASSIIKAIEKAWNESGKPSEFTIKILEEGQKGFLGLTKRPSIVSITFNSIKGQQEKSRFKSIEPDSQIKRTKPNQQTSRYDKRPLSEKSFDAPAGQHVKRADSQEFMQRQQASYAKTEKKPQENASATEDLQVWVPEWTAFVSDSLREMLKTLQFQSNFTTKTNKKILTIVFDKPMMENEEENRSLAMGISYLLMQFLKRKHKKKFRGYQIIVTSAASYESSKQNKSN